MEVHLYTLCWNEADMLTFFFRHYDPWVDRYVIFDDGSNDGSLDILTRHARVEVRPFVRTHPESFVLSHKQLQNEVWKESRGAADWVIITALDEHLQVKGWDNREYLAACKHRGVTLVPAVGFQMISEDFPADTEHLAASRTWGAPWSMMNKLSVIDPDAIEDTGFSEGRHRASPKGRLALPDKDELMLLHYKYLGFERTLRRHHEQHQGLGTTDLAHQWGVQYSWSRERFKPEWDACRKQAIDTGLEGFKPWAITAPHERWWRPGAEGSSSTWLQEAAAVKPSDC